MKGKLIEEEKKKFLKLNIPIDNKGHGLANFNASGYLEAVILPKMVSFPTIKIYPKGMEEYPAFHLKEQKFLFDLENSGERVFFPRVQMHDIYGKVINQFDKIYLSGIVSVEIIGGVPESQFEIVLVI